MKDRDLRDELLASIQSMEAKLHTLNKKYTWNVFYIDHPESNDYDLISLKNENVQIKENIDVLTRVLEAERIRLKDFSAKVSAGEDILKLHNPKHVCNFRGHHIWEVNKLLGYGPYRDEWSVRTCRVCGDVQRRGDLK